MNVCAVRTFTYSENPFHSPRPHEPVLDEGQGVLGDGVLWFVNPSETHKPIACCRHCGCLFAEVGFKDEKEV